MLEIQDALERNVERGARWSASLGPLLDEMSWGANAAIVSALESGDEDAVDDILEVALTGSAFQAELQAHVAAANLTPVNREQIEDGLAFLQVGRFASAGALLILGVEGALWHEAQHRGLVRRSLRQKTRHKMTFGHAYGTTDFVGGVEDLFDPLNLGRRTHIFLHQHVYGDEGNVYRHANAVDGWKRRSFMLVVTLVTVLQRMSGIDEPTEAQPVFEDDISNLLLRAFNA